MCPIFNESSLKNCFVIEQKMCPADYIAVLRLGGGLMSVCFICIHIIHTSILSYVSNLTKYII